MLKAEHRMNTLISKSIRLRATKFADNVCYYCTQDNTVLELDQAPFHLSKSKKRMVNVILKLAYNTVYVYRIIRL